MTYEIYLPQTFQRSVKLLKKKFPHIKDDLSRLFHNLQEDPQIGDPISGWKRKIWKIRAASRDLRRGKSGAFRVIYAWTSGKRVVYPLFVYFKGERENVTKIEIDTLLKKLLSEIEEPD